MCENILIVDDFKTNDLLVNSKTMSIEPSEMLNAVLKRLIEEVKYESQNNILAYDRAHNRHNRGR